ncbi:MAG: molybdopterin-dependent oxidoreductase [Acidimicrobiaceae bacterium]|nr:molybdopterin-dependent oxidoreductase [Acidimicrobiaceae bacterium]
MRRDHDVGHDGCSNSIVGFVCVLESDAPSRVALRSRASFDQFALRLSPSNEWGDVTSPESGKVNIGRRVFLGATALGALGIAFGGDVQSFLGKVFGSKLAGLLTGGDHFRIYSITGQYPAISESNYQLKVSGLVERPMTFTLSDLKALPVTSFSKTFQCVTGWRVPNVHWEGVQLSEILKRVGVRANAVALTFESYDGADSESLTIEQAHLPDVIVAYKMFGAPLSTEHGGPVRLYVAPMFGYKSLKWLSAIRVVDAVHPGYWELNGYPVNGWLDGTVGPTNPDPQLT